MTAKEVFAALAAPFPEEQIKTRVADKSGRKLSYITARTARSRLNAVLGPENWECQVEAAEKWVKCTITITLPEGKTISRSAIGGYPNMPSDEDRVKGGDSDAFKRACVLFGVGEHLYGDDYVEYAQTPHASRYVQDSSGAVTKEQIGRWFDKSKDTSEGGQQSYKPRGWPKDGRHLFAWLKDIEKDYDWPTIVTEVNDMFGPKSNFRFPGKITNFDEEQSNAVAMFVASRCSEVQGYNGEFDQKLGIKR